MTYLLDVNVLIALLDEDHVSHGAAHDWFEQTGARGWATCAITQNGYVRIVSAKSYGSKGWTLGEVRGLLQDFCDRPGHEFWAADISLLDKGRFDHDQLTQPGQITDAYLLALAVRHGGRLATLDRRLSPRSVRGGNVALMQIPPERSLA